MQQQQSWYLEHFPPSSMNVWVLCQRNIIVKSYCSTWEEIKSQLRYNQIFSFKTTFVFVAVGILYLLVFPERCQYSPHNN